ncbi:sphinganine kinase lcb4 [Stygiomarasmius scandens]|uniref:Sphinganine kinase lcb4 n=1 Tax=Marasmiellus scandens TaxID=2682957 RepID=A0ABR1JFE2_9AGAR
MAERELSLTVNGRPVKLVLGTELKVVKQGIHQVPFYQVAAASFHRDSRKLYIAYVLKKGKKQPYSFVELNGQVKEDEDTLRLAMEFAEALHEKAYHGVKYGRRLRVLVNPNGGVGKAVSIFSKQVEPLLKAAGCTLDVSQTTHNGHAFDIAKSLTLDSYDAVVTVSGDGLVHEVLNGFANHAEPRKALSIPVAPIPTGSGNGLSLNLLGLEDGFDILRATLNVIKGQTMHVDVFSITQGGKRTLSFMSQALGLMADLDIGTENLRWMGDTRFIYGLLRGLIKFKPCDVQLSYKGAEMDKHQMFQTLQSRRKAVDDSTSVPVLPGIPASPTSANFAATSTDADGDRLEDDPKDGTGLPDLKYSMEDTEGWNKFDEKLLYLYAGKGPFVGRDLMAFPVSLPDDGLIDIVVQSHTKTSRLEILGSFEGAPRGEQYWSDSIHYVKASAYRIQPKPKAKGCLSIDGEAFPFEAFQVEIHPGLGTLLSPKGYYAAEFAQPGGAVAKKKDGKKSGVKGGDKKERKKGTLWCCA